MNKAISRKLKIITLLKAARLERPLIPLSSIVLAAGFANKINLDIIILMVCCVLMYAVGGIVNAKIDNDYKIKHYRLTIAILFSASILLSLYNYIIFLTVLASLLLGFIYSRFSRRILFGDSAVLALTHSTLPIVSASLLLSLSLNRTLLLAGFMFAAIFLVSTMKNLNGVEDDIKRGYKTLMTSGKNGKKITAILLNAYFILLSSAYFVFGLGNKFLFVFGAMLAIKGIINYKLGSGQDVLAYKLARLIIIMFPLAVVFDRSANMSLLLLSSLLVGMYLYYLVK